MTTIFLIVGLGNPGSAYVMTNHNVGFACADFLADSLDFPVLREKFNGLYSEKTFEITTAGDRRAYQKIIILKPQTFMNSSGVSVQKFIQFYKINPENVVVIHDDLDLKPGTIRIKFSGSSGGHNGIKSIENIIGSGFWRIRVGIGRPDCKDYPTKDYVLAKISDELKQKLPVVFKAISNNIKEFLLEKHPKSISISKIKVDANPS